MKVQEFLENNILLFDGAMGTYCSRKLPGSIDSPCELLNISQPDVVGQIHREYLQAGCRAIKTNTFGVNRLAFDEATCLDAVKAGWEIAVSAAKETSAFVFADIGPVADDGEAQPFEEYKFIVDAFLKFGAENFLFETNSSISGLLETAQYIKSKNNNAFVLLSFAPMPDGFTRTGETVSQLISQAVESIFVDAVGLNCISGAKHMADLAGSFSQLPKPFSVMPNAGYPTVLGNRTYYGGSPEYYAEQLGDSAAQGVKILGGCCGTTPEYTAATFKALQNVGVSQAQEQQKRIQPKPKRSEFWNELCDSNSRPFAVEFDPPENADTAKIMAGAAELREHGVSVITIADCPVARARMDSSLLACKLHRELGMEVMPHMTCRDRNLNAIKALLLGLSAEGVNNVLTVTGDPIPTASRDEVKSVYNFNSRMLAGYITSLGEQLLPTPFRVFGALNVNAPNFDIQLKLAKEKEEKGVCGFFTQPVFTRQALENLKRARKELNAKILGGILPIISRRNAEFINSDIAGITIDSEIIERYEGADRGRGEELAVEISTDTALKISPYVDGFYLITPFGRVALVSRIIESINNALEDN